MTNRRTCIGCRAPDAPAALVRVVRRGDAVIVDGMRREPGRGAWIHATVACVELADRRRAWTRALRGDGALDTSAVQEWVRARV